MAERGLTGFRIRSRGVDDSDEALLHRVGEGDREAARVLMDRSLPRVCGLAQRMLGDAAEAEDVAQETFIRVWKSASRFEPGRAKVSTWISRIAINLCYDRLRKRREVLMDELPDRADETPDQEARLTCNESGNRVVDAVRQLPDRQRMAMELVHFQDMSNIAAAELMSVSVEALESLLARGRRKLKLLLMDQAGDLISSYHQVAVSQEGIER